MANVKTSNLDYEKVVVDTAPGADGFFTEPLSQRREPYNLPKLVVSVRGSGTFTPILQFKAKDDAAWTDSTETLAVGDVKTIEADAFELFWRVGIKQGGFTSGNATLSINW